MSWTSRTFRSVPGGAGDEDSDVPLLRGSRFTVLTESDDESDGEPLIRPAGLKRGRREHSPPASSGVAAHLGAISGDVGQVEFDMTLMDADTESLSTHSAGQVEHQLQEALLSRACAEDARVALLESVFVAMVLHVGRQSIVPVGGSPAEPVTVSEGWAQLDAVDLQEELLIRVPMLKSCPHWLRVRFGEELSVALRERCRAKLANDGARSERGNSSVWFPRCCCTDLAAQAVSVEMVTEFQQGHWEQLIREANEFRFQSIPVPTQTPEEEVTRRALAAQSRVQRRQVSRARQELTGATSAPRNAATFRSDALKSQRRQSHVRSWISNTLTTSAASAPRPLSAKRAPSATSAPRPPPLPRSVSNSTNLLSPSSSLAFAARDPMPMPASPAPSKRCSSSLTSAWILSLL